jgi:hypothetical protein
MPQANLTMIENFEYDWIQMHAEDPNIESRSVKRLDFVISC